MSDEDMLEQEAINRYLNMIANDYDGNLAKIFQEKYINKDKEIERLNKRVKECEEAYLRTRHQYSELEGKYVIDEYVINELEKELELNLKFKVIGVKRLKNKLQELKGDGSNE